MTALLDVSHLAAGYGHLPILFDVTFDVREGEIVVISGGNGAGKSTLLACLSGLLRPVTAGTIMFGGRDITSMRPWDICRTGLQHVLERRRLAPFMSVRDNLRLSEAAVQRGERSRWRERYMRLVAQHPLVRSHGDRHAAELSGGQQQMIAVLRGLLPDPRLLILDEPFQGLDVAVAADLIDLMRSCRDAGTTILLTEHRSEIIAGLESRQIRLERGAVSVDVPTSSTDRLSKGVHR